MPIMKITLFTVKIIPTNALYGQNAKLLDVKARGIYTNHCTLRGKSMRNVKRRNLNFRKFNSLSEQSK